MSRKLVFTLSLFILLCSLLYVKFNSVQVRSSNGYPVAPNFILTDIDGNSFSLDDYLARVVLLEFFRTSCPFCINQTSHLKILNEEFGEKFVIISISTENETILTSFREAYSINWTIAKDTSNVLDMYNVSGIPTLVIIDQDGYIRYRHEGPTEETVLSQEIQEILLPVHNINTGENYATIQEAIDANETLDGHTILVDVGFYDEYVYITKSLTIIGENRFTTIVDGRIFVWTNHSCVTQFTVQNGGIHIKDSHGNTIGNNILKNNDIGIAIYESSENTLRNNTMFNNTYNFDINGGVPSDFFQNIDSSNTVDGKPMYYLVSQHNQQIPEDAGYIALVNSTKIKVKNLSLKNNGMGVLLINCTHCTVENVTSNDGDGIDMRFSSNNTIFNNTFVSSSYAFFTINSDRNSMTYNRIHTDYGDGVWLQSSKYNVLSFNILSGFVGDGYFTGICLLGGSDSNVITGNTISSYYRGVLLSGSYNNTIYHNNFLVTHNQVCSNNFLEKDNEGNYYSTYVGVDLDNDGIGDGQYVVYEVIDNYPLMGIFSSFGTSFGYHVNVISNSTIKGFEYFESNSTIRMLVSNLTANQRFGFCRVCIPKDLMSPLYYVIIDDGLTEVFHMNDALYDNGTHRWIYFAYEHSIHEIDIIPEFPTFLILPLFMIATLLTVIGYRRKKGI